jgi:branched-chain amino acid transport system permease protein
MILYTFLINAALVALASLLITPIYLAKFTNGELLGLYAFIAAIVGGFNQVRGAVLGGLILAFSTIFQQPTSRPSIEPRSFCSS